MQSLQVNFPALQTSATFGLSHTPPLPSSTTKPTPATYQTDAKSPGMDLPSASQRLNSTLDSIKDHVVLKIKHIKISKSDMKLPHCPRPKMLRMPTILSIQEMIRTSLTRSKTETIDVGVMHSPRSSFGTRRVVSIVETSDPINSSALYFESMIGAPRYTRHNRSGESIATTSTISDDRDGLDFPNTSTTASSAASHMSTTSKRGRRRFVWRPSSAQDESREEKERNKNLRRKDLE